MITCKKCERELDISDTERPVTGVWYCGCSEGLPKLEIGDICIDRRYSPCLIEHGSTKMVKKNIVTVYRRHSTEPGYNFYTEIWRRPGFSGHYHWFEKDCDTFLIRKLEGLRCGLESLLRIVSDKLETLIRGRL